MSGEPAPPGGAGAFRAPLAVAAPTLDEIQAARVRISPFVRPTPLIPLPLDGAKSEIWLKLENLQPIGSFKLRGSANAILSAPLERLEEGIYTASAGNMAQGVAWNARRLGALATVLVPESAPATKVAAIERLGGMVVRLPFDRWWQVLEEHGYPGMDGLFVHPVSDTAVMAGNGTVGLEIVEQLPEVDTVLVPYGGGGLSVGIAAALRALRPRARVVACEVETAAPLAAALAAGHPVPIAHRPSFVDGIGGKCVLPEMWPHARELLAGTHTVTLEEVCAAIRLLVERCRVIAEGAGGASLAAALAGAGRGGKVVCVISGGNLDSSKLATILAGAVP